MSSLEMDEPTGQDGFPPIAIVGMACRFAGGASSPSKLWEMLAEKKSGRSVVPASRFNIDAFYHPDPSRAGAINCREGHFIQDDIAAFDASFFSISPAEAMTMDPQQRMVLESAFEAFENAGMPVEKLSGSDTSCYVGCSSHDYELGLVSDLEMPMTYLATGNSSALLANRISHFFNLGGPSLSIDTACSSGLSALDAACQSLWSGAAQASIVGGAQLIIHPSQMIALSKMHCLASDGRCHVFDERANGFARGEGIATVVLKPLRHAIRDGDAVRAVIRGSACSQDGKTLAVVMPSQSAQEALIESVYRRARCDPATVGYFEAHGTGTKVGDPVEAAAIGASIGRHRALGQDNRLYVGGIKSNLGHTEGCSGLAGLVKTVLALEKAMIPPNFGFEKGNPAIDFGAWRIRVPTELVPWPVSGVRRASINSFGFGGSNSHVILDDAYHYLAERGLDTSRCTSAGPGAATYSHGKAAGRHRILVWSGGDARAAKASLHAYRAHLESMDTDEEPLMRDLSHTLCQRRSRLATRTFLVANSLGGLVKRLGQPGPAPMVSPSKRLPRIAYVFTGQGAQWWGMARELLETYPVFQDSMARAEASLRSLGCPWSLRGELTKDQSDSRIDRAEYSSAACTAIQLGLVDLLADWGVLPDKVIGHSGGEMAAAYAAGKLPFESSLKAAYFRGLLVSQIEPKGSMLAVAMSEAAAADAISRLDASLGQVVVACINGPSSVTLSGDTAAIDELEKMLEDQEKPSPSHRLKVTAAFHSHHMQLVAGRYLESLADLATTEPGVASPLCGDMMSTVSCTSTAGLELHGQYWVDNLCRPVRFSDGLRALCSAASVDVVLEIGPHSALAAPIGQTLAAEGVSVAYYPLLVRNRDACETALEALAALWAHGAPARLDRANEPLRGQQAPRVLVDLPAYPWDHSKRFWAEARLGAAYRLRSAPRGDFVGAPVPDWNPHEPCWRNRLRVGEQPWLRDHVVQGSMIYPAAGYLAMVLEAAKQLAKSGNILGYTMADVAISRALVIPDTDEGVEVVLQARPRRQGKGPLRDGAWWDFRIYSHGSAGFAEHCRGLFSIDYEQAPSEVDGGRESRESLGHYQAVFESARDACKSPVRIEALYNDLHQLGLDFGPAFRNLAELKLGPDRALSKIRVLDTKKGMPFEYESEHLVHPVTMDAILQLTLPVLTDSMGLKWPYMPTFIEQAHVSSRVARGAGCELEACGEAAFVGLQAAEFSIVARNCPGEAPVVRMQGVRLAALASSDTVSVYQGPAEDKAPFIFAPEWQPDPDLMSRAELEAFLLTGTTADDGLAEFWSQTNTLAVYFFHLALSSVSLHQVVRPHHRKLYLLMAGRRREAMLAEDQRAKWLHFDTPEGKREVEEMMGVIEHGSAQGAIVCRLGRNLPGILRNEVEPLQLLFKDKLVENLYGECEEHRVMFHQMQKYLGLLSHKSPDLSYVEVGAGTGAATMAALETLGGAGDSARRFKRYMFTDISPSFLEKAVDRFQRWDGLVDYRPLDIEKSPRLQGFAEAGRFDVAIAFSVLHATADLDRSVRNTRRLLKPGGKLILLELTSIGERHSCIVGMLPGWWAAEDRHRQHGEGAFVSATKWAEILAMNGFGHVRSVTPNSENPDLETCSVIIADAVPVPDTGAADGPPPSSSVTVATAGGPGSQEAALVDVLGAELLAMGVDTLVKPYSDLSEADVSDRLCLVTSEMTQPLLKDMGRRDLGMLKTILEKAGGLVWATTGALGDSPRPDVALVPGLARALRNELSGFPLLTFDFSESQPSARRGAAMLMACLREAASGHVTETELSERNGLVHIKRYMEEAEHSQHVRPGPPTAPELQPFSQPGRPLTLGIGTPGLLDTLVFTDDAKADEPLPAHDVKVQVRAVGLNFRDVMIGLGRLDHHRLGFECSGVIQEVGSSVSCFGVGDRVFAAVPGSFSNALSAPAKIWHLMPDAMDFPEAASIPIVYCTTYYALAELAHIRAGETVLVHAAAGGIGQAAIQLCKVWGADIFATVGSREKKQFLMDTYAIAENHIFSSRNLDFADGIRRVTNGRGVDVVLNSLSGEGLEASWNLVAPCGRFIEIGKVDILEHAPLSMAPFDRNVMFASVDLSRVLDERPEFAFRVLHDVVDLMRDGAIKPIPLKTFSFAKLEDAFRLMQRGLHMGKIVLLPQPDDLVPAVPRARVTGRLRPDATYLIAGGFGGLGRGLARHMASKGARNLILLSRSGARAPEAKALVGDLRDGGVQVEAVACDVADAERVDEILSVAMERMPPIRGVIQAAMVLDDCIFANMSLGAWANAVAPKVHGSWVLHKATLHQPLDFFIMLSSLSGIMGIPSQGNYAAANTFLDSLAHYRTCRRLPATTIDFCGIDSIGYVSENPRAQATLDTHAISTIGKDSFFAIIDLAVDALPKKCQLMVGLQKLTEPGGTLEDLVEWQRDPAFSHLQNSKKGRRVEPRLGTAMLSFEKQLSQATSLQEAEAVIFPAILKRLSRSLGITLGEDEASGPGAGFAIDSLVAIDLRKWLMTTTQADISVFEAMQAPSLKVLSAQVAARSRLVRIAPLDTATSNP